MYRFFVNEDEIELVVFNYNVCGIRQYKPIITTSTKNNLMEKHNWQF